MTEREAYHAALSLMISGTVILESSDDASTVADVASREYNASTTITSGTDELGGYYIVRLAD
jgi:hypothetical protein